MKSFFIVWIARGKDLRFSFTSARRPRLRLPVYIVPGSSGAAGLNVRVTSPVHSARPLIAGWKMKSPWGVSFRNVEAKCGVNLISMGEFTETIPEV